MSSFSLSFQCILKGSEIGQCSLSNTELTFWKQTKEIHVVVRRMRNGAGNPCALKTMLLQYLSYIVNSSTFMQEEQGENQRKNTEPAIYVNL